MSSLLAFGRLVHPTALLSVLTSKCTDLILSFCREKHSRDSPGIHEYYPHTHPVPLIMSHSGKGHSNFYPGVSLKSLRIMASYGCARSKFHATITTKNITAAMLLKSVTFTVVQNQFTSIPLVKAGPILISCEVPGLEHLLWLG